LNVFWLVEAALLHDGEEGYVSLETCIEMLRSGPVLA
jgi:hypothetical protein